MFTVVYKRQIIWLHVLHCIVAAYPRVLDSWSGRHDLQNYQAVSARLVKATGALCLACGVLKSTQHDLKLTQLRLIFSLRVFKTARLACTPVNRSTIGLTCLSRGSAQVKKSKSVPDLRLSSCPRLGGVFLTTDLGTSFPSNFVYHLTPRYANNTWNNRNIYPEIQSCYSRDGLFIICSF